MLGIKWKAIDFEKNIINIEHSVVEIRLDGKQMIIAKDKLKNKSSHRVYPLLPMIKEILLKEKQVQKDNRDWFQNSYTNRDSDYICVNEYGERLGPSFLSSHFQVIIKNNKLTRIKFHELRHSCASLLLSMGISMKEIQEWLGHSTYNTTADIYSHLDYGSKMNIANSLNIFNAKEKPEKNSDLTTNKNETNEEEYDDEIAKLERLLAEKKRARKNQAEM